MMLKLFFPYNTVNVCMNLNVRNISNSFVFVYLCICYHGR